MSSMSPCYITVMVPESLHGRPLPPELVALASTAGQAWFAEALAAGTMASYFAVAEQVQTQADPAYCGLTSMAVALNSLGIDPGPGRTWKGPWRWFSEELVACCLSLERVRAEGVTLDQVAMLGRCNGAVIDLKHADAFTVDELRTAWRWPGVEFVHVNETKGGAEVAARSARPAMATCRRSAVITPAAMRCWCSTSRASNTRRTGCHCLRCTRR